MRYKKPEIRKINEIFKRIGKTGKISNDDAEYIRRHYWDFQIPMFVRKKRISDKELDHIVEHYQDYRIPMFVRRKKR